MNFNNLVILLSLLLLSACQPNEELLIDELEVPPSVELIEQEIEGGAYDAVRFHPLHNAQVRLMYEGKVWSQVNTDESGRFDFGMDLIPAKGAVLVITSANYLETIHKVEAAQKNYFSRLFPDYYLDVVNGALTDGPAVVNITGTTMHSNVEAHNRIFVKNEDNEIAGNGLTHPDLGTDFTFSVLANEKLNLYIDFPCGLSGPFPIGPFSEDSDIGVLNSDPGVENRFTVKVQAVDCGLQPVDDVRLIYKYNNQEGYSFNVLPDGTSTFEYFRGCEIMNDDINVLAYHYVKDAYGNYSIDKIGEVDIPFVAGQDLEETVTVCDENETYFKYKIGLQDEISIGAFTLINLYDDKPSYGEVATPVGFDSFDFELNGVELGTQSGKVHKRWTDLDFVLENATFEITLNDDEYIEGTFSGLGLDAFEQSIGNVTGSFKARKQ